MRLAQFVVAVVALTAAAHLNDAQVPAAHPWTIDVVWPAPAGHFQPRASDIPAGIPLSPSRVEQESRDRQLDRKLTICRGC
jgi:hypothetical protein